MIEVKLAERDAQLLRASFAVARNARMAGNHPFGAILADAEGNLLLDAENTVVTETDVIGHAETNLIRMAWRQWAREQLATCTLYASTEPCPMCSGAIYWGNIGRVVYGLSQEHFYEVGAERRRRSGFILHCRDMLTGASKAIEVVGPALEDEALDVHKGFWG